MCRELTEEIEDFRKEIKEIKETKDMENGKKNTEDMLDVKEEPIKINLVENRKGIKYAEKLKK